LFTFVVAITKKTIFKQYAIEVVYFTSNYGFPLDFQYGVLTTHISISVSSCV